MKSEQGRREFLQIAAAGATLSLTGVGSVFNRPIQAADRVSHEPSKRAGFELGLASYTLREFNLDQTLAIAKRLALKQIAFKSFHLELGSSPEHIKETVAKVSDAGLTLYGASVVYMLNEAQVHQAFDYARNARMKVIIGVPRPDLLPLVERRVKEYDIRLAIHNHGPGDKLYPLPVNVYERIKDLDRRIGLCIDIGHTIRAGGDPLASIREFADRLYDVHIKDVSAAAPNGHDMEVGRGVIDIPEILRALAAIDYTGVAAFEYEKDGKDPVPGLAESVGFVRGVIAAMA